jgi:hypothetical protein
MYTKAGSREVIYEGLGAQYREFKVERPVVNTKMNVKKV